MISKAQLRREVEKKRALLDPHWVAAASAQIVQNICCLEEFRSAQTVAIYMAIPGEVDLSSLVPLCRAQGKRTCIPVFNRATKQYDLAEWSEETRFSTGYFGIREPVSPVLAPVHSIDFMAVPGVAFDRIGNRLGRGGGHYDRLLAGFGGFAAAVAFGFQLVPAVPAEPHDRPVAAIVTESAIFEVRNEH